MGLFWPPANTRIPQDKSSKTNKNPTVTNFLFFHSCSFLYWLCRELLIVLASRARGLCLLQAPGSFVSLLINGTRHFNKRRKNYFFSNSINFKQESFNLKINLTYTLNRNPQFFYFCNKMSLQDGAAPINQN